MQSVRKATVIAQIYKLFGKSVLLFLFPNNLI
jgi:hypothetical protein